MIIDPPLKMCAVADTNAQREAIREATEKSLMSRDLYTEQVVYELTQVLATAQDHVTKALTSYKGLSSLPENRLAAVNGLEKLDAEIAEAMKTLKREETLRFRKASQASFRAGVYRGIEELATAQMPFYRELTPEGMDKLTTSVFTLIDTDALDFMANYNLVLLGDVHTELASGIKRTILSGITSGRGVRDIVRDMGEVITDKDSFRNAGSRVFTKAQYRMEMIARTEVLRAHNQGRIKFHKVVGVSRLEWLTLEDERTCPVCGGLDGRVFEIDQFPNQPAHPNCRCTNVVAWPLIICGGDLGAAGSTGQNSCILPPQAIDAQAKEKAEAEKKIKASFDSGEVADLSALTVKELQTLAKGNGIAIARTKADFIKLLDAVEPGVHHADLTGAALMAKVKQFNIAALRSKDDLVTLLAQKQAQIKQAKLLEEAAKKAAKAPDLANLTMVQLKEMAKQHGVSLNITKSEVIEMLDVLESGVDHSNLAGQALLAAKEKYGIPPLKNKEQLVKALEKSAGQKLAEQAKVEALNVAKEEALKKAEQALKDATAQIVLPSSPSQYAPFLDTVKAAEAELAKDSGFPASVVEAHAKEVAVKKLAFQQQIQVMKVGDLKTLAKETKVKHWQWASKDELITFFTETDQAKVNAAVESIEKKHTKWAEKNLGSSKPKGAQPKQEPAPTVPQTVTTASPAAFTKKGSEFEEVDVAWSEKGKPGKFKLIGKASVGGAHEKEFWEDALGNRWMFKPVKASKDDFIAHGEEAAYRVGRLIDPDAIEVRVITLDGRTGSIQKWRTDLAARFDFSGLSISDFTADEMAQIQREHVIDWLISNHDGHAKQFLRGKDGKVYGIDKGQLFKYLGTDKLSTDYHPNGVFGEQEPLYNTLFRAARDGQVTVDPSVTLRYIREVEKISDDDYLSLLKPYAEGRFMGDDAGKRHFYDLALQRKHSLRGDFEGFYADVLRKPSFRFEDAIETPSVGRIGKAEEEIIEEARVLGWQGKALPIDESDIEDQNALIFTESIGGKMRTVIKMKVRPEAESKILPELRRRDRQTPTRVGQALPEDSFSGDILAAVKTINHHAGDGAYNRSTLERAKNHLPALRDLTKSADPDVRAMAENYIGWIERVEQSAKDRASIPEKFEQYIKKHRSPRKLDEKADFTVKKGKVLLTKRTIEKGELAVEREDADNTSLFRGRAMKDGEQYEVDFGDGIRAVYRPWSDKNHYAQQGEFEMVIPERPDPKTLDQALVHMEKLGLKANIATSEDAELLYLTKQAYVSKVDKEPDYLEMLAGLDQRGATKPERVQAMRAYWEKRLRVNDITKMRGYDPVGEYQLGFRDRTLLGGYRQQYRFDLSDADLEREMKGYSLFHSLTNGNSIPGFLDMVLENNGAMISTVEKLRSGVAPGGMSPEEDMNSGGATYVFTRIRKSPTSGGDRNPGIYLKNRLLRRMDAISYDHDAYGRVKDNYVVEHRGSDPRAWKHFSHRTSNETIFKYSVTLLDNVEHIVVGSDSERRSVLDVFRKHGVSVLPDGRRVDDVVLTR